MDKQDKICLIDRYPQSPAFGNQVLPFASLLKNPKMMIEAKDITGALQHGHDVVIIDKKQDNNQIWCKVRGVVSYQGKELVQEGWVLRQLLENEGLEFFETMYQAHGDEVI